ncbi:hypothetical protein D9757_015252 [Collybiopsis confluens]|uniref:Protein kinase domain-containing protein n=1 Tax=Collybiopsis confluens TaxID=2823264 RepID=A0A8H5FP23_9AGAR|nr:hypothetical protein D9757_015252 [Collybiopsis confluens]
MFTPLSQTPSFQTPPRIIAKPEYLFIFENLVLPQLQSFDPSCQDLSELTIYTDLYKITLHAFFTLYNQRKAGSYKAINLDGSSAFKLGPEDALPDVTLVVFRPPASTQVNSIAEPFFRMEPSLALQQPALSPSSSPLYPSFIRVRSGSGFCYDDLALNHVEHVPTNDLSHPLVPSHVQAIWKSLSRPRNVTSEVAAQLTTRQQLDKLKTKLTKHNAGPQDSLDDLFTVLQAHESRDVEFTQEPIVDLELDHYGHIIKYSGLRSRRGPFSVKFSLETSLMYFFFANLMMYIEEHMPEYDVVEAYQTMPIAKLVIEKLDEVMDILRFAPYYPKSDIGIWSRGSIWPGLLAEFHSGNLSTIQVIRSPDHIRMFLQGASLVRMMNIAQRDAPGGMGESLIKTSVLPLIYVTKDWSRATVYLLFEVGLKVYYLQRTYNIVASLSSRLRFARDLYNILDHIKNNTPSDELKEKLRLLEKVLRSVKTAAKRVDTEEDKKRKSANEENKSADKGAKQARNDASGEDVEEECLNEAFRLGYNLRVVSSVLLVGQGPRGNKVVAKRVQPGSEELKIHLKLQYLEDSHKFVLPIIQRFDLPLEGPTTSTYLVFSRWIPVTDIQKLMLKSYEIVAACSALARGVEFLHNNLIAHLDLKPDNLILQRSTSGRIQLRIIDFSVSTMLSNKEEKRSAFQGTMGFMAPEVAECEADPSLLYLPLKADLYSCGRVFLFFAWCITSKHEFHKVLDWGNKLIAQAPNARPELANLPDLLVDSVVMYNLHVSPTANHSLVEPNSLNNQGLDPPPNIPVLPWNFRSLEASAAAMFTTSYSLQISSPTAKCTYHLSPFPAC